MNSRACASGLFAATAVVLSVCNAVAASFDFTSFPSTDGLNLQGDAGLALGALRLAGAQSDQHGSAWYAVQQPVGAGFTTTFQFQITDSGGMADPDHLGADGLALVIQDAGETALGSTSCGQDMAYANIPKSLAIEFDTFDNEWCGGNGDPNGNHISVQTCGIDPNNSAHASSLGATTDIPNMLDGNVHTALITYMSHQLHIALDGTEVLDVPVDLTSALALSNGMAWVGFTAATGAGYGNHDILNWSLATVPEPSTIGLLVTGAISVLACAWRRRK